jgi:mono/diheme cytochrome c family protein
VPTVPRWQTWYGVDDFKRTFRRLYADLGPDGRKDRIDLDELTIDAAIDWAVSAVDRSQRWPLDRFFKHVKDLGGCAEDVDPGDCAQSLQSNFSGATGGNARITYSPGALKHLLTNYGAQLNCIPALESLPLSANPVDPEQNFSFCFSTEFPADAVLIKAQWARADFGRDIPVFDTDAASLAKVLGSDKSANWADGDRRATPTTDQIFTIRLRNGDTYRLVGLHIMTKELRHWVWTTLWWSDTPDLDFGADRPEDFVQGLDPVWRHYKMAVVVDYNENDPDAGQWFDDQPTLQAALRAQPGEYTWASNPYIEHGRGNARTNCIGCHQHGGSTVAFDLDEDGQLDPFNLEDVIEKDALYPANGRSQQRTIFPADYLWSTQRVDNLRQVMLSEVGHFEAVDQRSTESRRGGILALEGAIAEGTLIFANHCTSCHGAQGEGSLSAPALKERIPNINETQLVDTLLTGKDNMPSWSHFSDRELADLRAFLVDQFGPTAP